MSVSTWLPLVAAVTAAAALGWLTGAVLRLLARRHPFLASADARCRWPWTATLVGTAALTAVGATPALTGEPWPVVRQALEVAVIGAVTWLLIRVAHTVEDGAFRRLRLDIENNRRNRKMRTQVTIMRRIVVALLVVIGTAVALMTFPQMRALGASLLASAGLAGIIGGLAAQSTLGNVFAGLQLAFTDALRIDDVVVVESEWGRVEDITLTYVVVHLWDERRLVLPTSYFTTTPFQNWTRDSARVLGAVELHLDVRTPVDRLRVEAERVVHGSTLWDREAFVVQVTDSTPTTMVVRVLASAVDAERAFDLRCLVRERLLAWVRDECPTAAPTVRVSSASADAVALAPEDRVAA